jgi:predicted cytidylate kinase
MIITISGLPGSGKSTVGRMLANRLGYRFFSIGELRGEIAMRMGKTIDELNEIGKSEDWTDRQADEHTKRMGETEDDCIIDGWVAFHFIPASFKLFLECDVCEASRRIFRDQRKDERKARSAAGVQEMISRRLSETDARYRKHYGIDFLERRNYDLVIDTTAMSPEQVVERVLAALKRWKGAGIKTIYTKPRK